MMNNATTTVQNSTEIVLNHTAVKWLIEVVKYRKEFFLHHVEPWVVFCLGPVVDDPQENILKGTPLYFLHSAPPSTISSNAFQQTDSHGRQLGLLPSYVQEESAYRETSMSFATLVMLFAMMSCILLILMSCFFHNQKSSPFFNSPRRHRLPKLVPPPLPVDGFFSWLKICFLLSDEEIINRIGFDSLVFLRFHRLALRCIVKMSIFSCMVLLPLNFTGGGHANAEDLKRYVGKLFFTDFLRFTMANVSGGSPRLWVHCFAAYLLTAIVIRELLVEYEAFNSIRHRYLLSREPHLRTVLVTNIPRHLRSPSKLTTYFRHVYPQAVQAVILCQNLIVLEKMVNKRTLLLAQIEKEILMLCRSEKRKLYETSIWSRRLRQLETMLTRSQNGCCGCCRGSDSNEGEHCCSRFCCPTLWEGYQERLAKLYTKLEQQNEAIEKEQRRRQRVMKRLDRMEAGKGRQDIDYILASPFVTSDYENDPRARKALGLQQQQQEEAPVYTMMKDSSAYRPPSIGAPRNPDGSLPMITELTGDEGDSSGSRSGPVGQSGSSEGNEGEIPQRAKGKQARFRSSGPVADNEESGRPSEERIKRRRTSLKAGHAIKRYSRLAREVNFFGRPIRSSIAATEGNIEDHVNEVTDKAFVEMRTFTAATIAIQSMHSSKPGAMNVMTAPEPRDVLWNNIYVSKGAARTRSYIGESVVLLVIAFYVVPVALVSLLVSASSLISSSPRLAQLDEASSFFATAIAMVQPMCIVTLQQLLPPLFIMIGEAEGLVSFSEIQMRTFSRYFLFQVVNVFLVTTIAGSIFNAVAAIIDHPEAMFQMLGNSLPHMSSFFITFIIIKAFFGLGLELVRFISLGQAVLRYALFPNATLRTQRSILLGMRAIDDPGWFPFHKILAQDMLIVVISVVFAVVAPLVLIPSALFCLFSRILWTHHHLYVYESVFETGGQFWPKIFRRFVFGLIIAQMTITGQFILKEARHEAYATIALMFGTYLFLRSTRARYDPSSSTLPLEVATVMDISLSQEQEAIRRRTAVTAAEQIPFTPTQEMSDRRTHTTTSSVPESGDFDFDPNLGAKIGQYDLFEHSYLQPALRANPRARPEQPFPPAQLGREEMLLAQKLSGTIGSVVQLGGSSQAEDSVSHDSSATVRPHNMSQQNRRLIDRWWNDRLQSCGEQNTMNILIGEECGTLTLGRRASLVESSTPSMHTVV